MRVHACLDGDEEISARVVVSGQPREGDDAAVVEHVQEGQLAPLGAGDDEQRVHVVHPLAHVEQPARVRLHLVLLPAARVNRHLHRLTHQTWKEARILKPNLCANSQLIDSTMH